MGTALVYSAELLQQHKIYFQQRFRNFFLTFFNQLLLPVLDFLYLLREFLLNFRLQFCYAIFIDFILVNQLGLQRIKRFMCICQSITAN